MNLTYSKIDSGPGTLLFATGLNEEDVAMAFEYTSIGWIGLGLMGIPMVETLIAKTPKSCQYYIFDVMAKPIDELCAKYPNKVHKCQSSKEVADKSVCMEEFKKTNWKVAKPDRK